MDFTESKHGGMGQWPVDYGIYSHSRWCHCLDASEFPCNISASKIDDMERF